MTEIILSATEPEYPSIVVQTRKGKDSDITNNQVNTKLSAWDMKQAEEYYTKYNFATFRTNPCGFYNCHGLTFASRRTRIYESQDIMRILVEDNYKEISIENVLAGDIVVYYNNGDPTHSGNVVEVPISGEKRHSNIKVLSKWGHGQEVVHTALDCPYTKLKYWIVYYRVQSIRYGDKI